MENRTIAILGIPNLGQHLAVKMAAAMGEKGIVLVGLDQVKSPKEEVKEFALICRRHDPIPDLSDVLCDEKPEPFWMQQQKRKQFARRGGKS